MFVCGRLSACIAPAGAPVASTVTEADGRFSITIARLQPGAFGLLFVAHVADGDPTKAFTWRRLSDSTNAFSASSQATYCPPIPAGQAYWRSGRN